MIRNYTTIADLRHREPELARLKQNDNELEAILSIAFNDFCNQLSEGRRNILSKIFPVPLYDGDVKGSMIVKIPVIDTKKILNRLVLDKQIIENNGENKLILHGSNDGVRYTKMIDTIIDNNELQSAKFYLAYNHYELEIIQMGSINMRLYCTLVQSPFDTCIEFLALAYAFESLIKTNDIYLVKADRYRALYTDRLEKLIQKCTNSDNDSSYEVIEILK
jgi:hypothetical protein